MMTPPEVNSPGRKPIGSPDGVGEGHEDDKADPTFWRLLWKAHVYFSGESDGTAPFIDTFQMSHTLFLSFSRDPVHPAGCLLLR